MSCQRQRFCLLLIVPRLLLLDVTDVCLICLICVNLILTCEHVCLCVHMLSASFHSVCVCVSNLLGKALLHLIQFVRL